MNASLETLFPEHSQLDGSTVTALNHHDVVAALSAALSTEKVAVLHMLYPRTDERTHRSLDTLVDLLHGHGMHEVAGLIAKEVRYLLFRETAKAWKVFHEIRNDSLAIGVHLYYRGLVGAAAENALDADVHRKA
jgi:hypothetical protein